MPGLVEPFYRQLRLTCRWRTLFPPIEPLRLAMSLEELGYVIPDGIVRSAGLGMNVTVDNGVIARKGSIAVIATPDRGFLGLAARDPDSLTTEFLALEEFLESHHNIDQKAIALFYEFHAVLTVAAQRPPEQAWPSHFADVPYVRKASEIIGYNLSPFGLRLASQGQHANSEEWIEVRIEPSVLSVNPEHTVESIFRRRDRDEVVGFAHRFEETLFELLQLVESGQVSQ